MNYYCYLIQPELNDENSLTLTFIKNCFSDKIKPGGLDLSRLDLNRYSRSRHFWKLISTVEKFLTAFKSRSRLSRLVSTLQNLSLDSLDYPQVSIFIEILTETLDLDTSITLSWQSRKSWQVLKTDRDVSISILIAQLSRHPGLDKIHFSAKVQKFYHFIPTLVDLKDHSILTRKIKERKR